MSGNTNLCNCGGGGIRNDGTASIKSVTITTNADGAGSPGGGGGIYSQGTLVVTSSTVMTNTASVGGGIYGNGGTLSLANTTISGNSVGDVATVGTLFK